jgi:hypothetical protein
MNGHLYLLMKVWAVLQSLWPASWSASCWSSCRQWRLFSLHLLLFCLFFLASMLSNALHYRYDMQMYCTFVLFVNQHFSGLPTSGTHCTIFVYYDWGPAIQGMDRRLWEWLWNRIRATWNCHTAEVHPFSCSVITFWGMSVACMLIAQHCNRIKSAMYCQLLLHITEACKNRTNCLKA